MFLHLQNCISQVFPGALVENFLMKRLFQDPVRKGVVSHTLMVEELGRRKINHKVAMVQLCIEPSVAMKCMNWHAFLLT